MVKIMSEPFLFFPILCKCIESEKRHVKMANYQNNMRYGRNGNPYPQYSNCMNQRQMQPEKNDCGCKEKKDTFTGMGMTGMPIAMAYVPWQKWRRVYDVCEGFAKGTIFQELDLPFEGRGGCNR